ncbi:DNA-binding LacI/PurR family transcriptional regulator [Pseudoduganella lurida]|uniref:DNA-binding LacI/PurR family transcriptional regulator n=1 Tax=Pseudoduganella lurida TaxID=1036180 RepID=A0A562RJU2_9BURK|nr:LacI family DNA-binding transcriptional regulator [Pseudoduganella lurida]TWI69193.1 DNA-binding LacI/PurR family transcriptional regulator [Pseudoduganella lurida]
MRKPKIPPQEVNLAEHKAAIQREERRVTSYDVAMVAGVSQSAVSRCFKPGASVSKSTYARVMKAAAGLDYIPNAAARSLITRRSNMVAVVLSQLANQHLPAALAELSQQLTRRGKRVLLFTMQQEADIGHVLADVWQYQVDGAIVVAALSDEQVQEFERRRLPLVVFNRNLRNRTVTSVLCDQYECGSLLAARLATAGHRHFGIIAGPAESVVAAERRDGACDRLRELGLPAPVVVTGGFDYASGAQGLRDIVARLGRHPDAIICGNDLLALGCLDVARHELRIDVPGRMSVAGFDAPEPSTWPGHDLTTLRQPIHAMALAAVDMLVTMMDSTGQLAEKRTFAPQFVDGTTARLVPLEEATLAA